MIKRKRFSPKNKQWANQPVGYYGWTYILTPDGYVRSIPKEECGPTKIMNLNESNGRTYLNPAFAEKGYCLYFETCSGDQEEAYRSWHEQIELGAKPEPFPEELLSDEAKRRRKLGGLSAKKVDLSAFLKPKRKGNKESN